MNLAYCYIENNTSALDQTYIYQFDQEAVEVGKRVLVNFHGRECIAFVDAIKRHTEQHFSYPIKPILRVLDDTPVLNAEMIELAKWMSKTTVSTVISALQAMVPSQLKPKSSHIQIKMEKWVRPLEDHTTTKKQRSLYEYLQTQKQMKRSEWLKLSSVAKKLEEMGCVEIFEKESESKEEIIEKKPCMFELNDEQKHAVERILSSFMDVLCLIGVTGSGKTEVFLHAAEEVLKKGRQVLFLVPEISLTPLMEHRVKERFGNDVAIYHSGLNAQQKYEQYQSVRQKKKKIVVGTRSAVFMPFDDLGLIIMDEEHDLSYKQESNCRYHARDVAIHRGKTHHAKVVLASATPSLDTMARAMKQVYEKIEIKHRVNQSMPQIKLINMNEAIRKKESYLLSHALIDAIDSTLKKKQQVILLLNRRGYQPVLRCQECGKVVMCPHCDKPLVLHKDKNMLHCHLCGTVMKRIYTCPSCQGQIKGSGFGTQLLEEKVKELFPQARIIRMDADTTTQKQSHQKLLSEFEHHHADILLGTQMIAKGLDFENVTLVGILQGDAMLARSDYRSAELTFDLLMQASGRSGRGAKDGQVLIQVYDDQHYAIRCAVQQDYERFFKHEMQYRHLASYPPYTYLCAMSFISKNAEMAYDEASQIMHGLSCDGFKVLGVSELLKIKDEYRYRICIKSKSQEKLQQAVYAYYQQHRVSKSKVKLQIDMNPQTLGE